MKIKELNPVLRTALSVLFISSCAAVAAASKFGRRALQHSRRSSRWGTRQAVGGDGLVVRLAIPFADSVLVTRS